MKKSRITLLYNKLIYFVISFILVDLSRKFFPLIIILIIFLFKLRKEKCFKYLIFSIFLFLLSISFLKQKPSVNKNQISINAEVIDVLNNYSILKENDNLFIIYDTSYSPGDILSLTGKFKEIDSPNLKYVFSFEKYMNNKSIYNFFEYKKIEKIDQKFNYRIFNYNLKSYITNNYERSDYYKALILSDSKISNQGFKDLGISHLLCISGMHINIIISFFKKLFKIKDKYFIIPIFLYTVLLGFKIALLRVFLSFLFNEIFKNLSKLDNLSLCFIILLLINPNYIFDIGFILTFIVSFSLLLSEKYKMLIANIITMPIIVYLNDKINILSILFNYIFTYIFKYLLIPLTFICFIIKPLDFIYSFIIEYLEYFIDLINFNFLNLFIPSFSNIEYLIYYLLLFILLKYKKLYYLLFMLFHMFKGSYVIIKSIEFLDVGQGDSTLILTNNSRIMIDCYNTSYLYIKKRGIKYLDYLIITHSDNDHIGSVDKLLENVKVKNIILSEYDDYYINGAKRVKSGDVINTNDINFNVLGPINKKNDLNNNSIVLQFEFINKTFLLTGDMEKEEEDDLIKKYDKKLKSDILKVGHHGSKTSSSKAFIEYVKPEISVISVGLNNKYNHPDLITLDNLNSSTIYQTKDFGTIKMIYVNKFQILY